MATPHLSMIDEGRGATSNPARESVRGEDRRRAVLERRPEESLALRLARRVLEEHVVVVVAPVGAVLDQPRGHLGPAWSGPVLFHRRVEDLEGGRAGLAVLGADLAALGLVADAIAAGRSLGALAAVRRTALAALASAADAVAAARRRRAHLRDPHRPGEGADRAGGRVAVGDAVA